MSKKSRQRPRKRRRATTASISVKLSLRNLLKADDLAHQLSISRDAAINTMLSQYPPHPSPEPGHNHTDHSTHIQDSTIHGPVQKRP